MGGFCERRRRTPKRAPPDGLRPKLWSFRHFELSQGLRDPKAPWLRQWATHAPLSAYLGSRLEAPGLRHLGGPTLGARVALHAFLAAAGAAPARLRLANAGPRKTSPREKREELRRAIRTCLAVGLEMEAEPSLPLAEVGQGPVGQGAGPLCSFGGCLCSGVGLGFDAAGAPPADHDTAGLGPQAFGALPFQGFVALFCRVQHQDQELLHTITKLLAVSDSLLTLLTVARTRRRCLVCTRDRSFVFDSSSTNRF